MLSRILRSMNIAKWFRREKRTDEELREDAESKVRAAEELRQAEMNSQRSRESHTVPSPQSRSGPF